jgi:hypothetical protein
MFKVPTIIFFSLISVVLTSDSLKQIKAMEREIDILRSEINSLAQYIERNEDEIIKTDQRIEVLTIVMNQSAPKNRGQEPLGGSNPFSPISNYLNRLQTGNTEISTEELVNKALAKLVPALTRAPRSYIKSYFLDVIRSEEVYKRQLVSVTTYQTFSLGRKSNALSYKLETIQLLIDATIWMKNDD